MYLTPHFLGFRATEPGPFSESVTVDVRLSDILELSYIQNAFVEGFDVSCTDGTQV